MTEIIEGSKVPNFSIAIGEEESWTLGSHKGRNIVIYFYPKDNTPGCTSESVAFAAHHAEFQKHNAVILGISKDSLKSHQKFIDKYSLPFPLGSDGDGEVCELFNAWIMKSMYGRKYMGIERSTFLINSEGVVKKIWRKVKVKGHVEEVLEQVKTL